MKRRKASYIWLATLLVPLGWDAYAVPRGHETASEALSRGLSNKWVRLPIVFFSALTLKHLFMPELLPRSDPYKYAANKLRERVNKDGIRVIQ